MKKDTKKEKINVKDVSVKPRLNKNEDAKISFEAPTVISEALNRYVKKKGLVKKTVIVAALVEYLKTNDPTETARWLSE
jgi:hypothetical protein